MSNTRKRESHGMHGTRIYRAWQNMKSRCNNPNASKYHLYGGKGIRVCDEWSHSFITFHSWAMENGYTDELTLDRIDGNKNYEPSNCRWATYEEQANNTTQNNLVTYNGITLNTTQWAEKLGMNPNTFSERLRRGWTIERAIETPTMDMSNFGNFVKELKKTNAI